MSASSRWNFKGLFMLWTLASVWGVEIDGKLGTPENDSREEPLTQPPYALEVVGTSPCPPDTTCLLLNLVLGPSSLVSLVPVLKGKSVATAVTSVPVVNGKPVQPLVPLVPVIKGKPVEPLVPLVPVIKGKPVTHFVPVTGKPVQQWPSARRTKTKSTTLCCFEMRFYDYLGRPCRPSYFPPTTSKSAHLPTATDRNFQAYPASHSGGVYPSSSYPTPHLAGHPSTYPTPHIAGHPSTYPTPHLAGHPSTYPTPHIAGHPSAYPATHLAGRHPSSSYPTPHLAGHPSTYPTPHIAGHPSTYPATHRSHWRERPHPPRPLKGGVERVPWTPLSPSARPVVKVDGKLGFVSEGNKGTVDSRVDGKVDGKLGLFK